MSVKRTKKSHEQPLKPDFSDIPFNLLPPFPGDAERTIRSTKEILVEAGLAFEQRQKTQSLFTITSESLFQFAAAWNVHPPIRRGETVSLTAVNKIVTGMEKELKVKVPPDPKTIRKCFKLPDKTQRAGAALVTRQLLCITFGKLSGSISIEGTEVRFQDASALAKSVSGALNTDVTEADLQKALDRALETTIGRR